MDKNIDIYVKFCSNCMCSGGAVVESWAAELKDVIVRLAPVLLS
jgi:hypothetical protein